MNPGSGDDRASGSTVRPEGGGAEPAPDLRALGMAIFLVSLSMLFAGCIVAYLVIRIRVESWPPSGATRLPRTLWLSTALVLGCSAAVQGALARIRVGDRRALVRRLGITMLLALLFLGSQTWSWVRILGEPSFRTHLYGFTFVMLTGLHGVHVLGGIVALVAVGVLALRGAYTRTQHSGVRNCAIYWHFLTVVWLILFGLLLAG
jgi:cytochrome c oxidase subunit 3